MSNIWSKLTNLGGLITGTLPLANGGTNSTAAATNGGLVYSDTTKMAITSAGTSQNWVLSGGAGAPTMSNTTTTGKFVDGSADEIQMRVQAHSTQTSDILSVEKSDATTLLEVTNVNGTKIRGTTTNDSAASGFVREFLSNITGNSTNIATSAAYFAPNSIVLNGGEWEVWGVIQFLRNAVTFSSTLFEVWISGASGTNSPNETQIIASGFRNTDVPITFTAFTLATPIVRVLSNGTDLDIGGVTTSASQTVYLKGFAQAWASGSPQYRSFTYAKRVR